MNPVADQTSTSSTNEEHENQATKPNTFIAVLACLLALSGILVAITCYMLRKRRKLKHQLLKTDELEFTHLMEKKVIIVGLSEDGSKIKNEIFEFNLYRPNEVFQLPSVPTEMQLFAVAVTYSDQLFVIAIGDNWDEIWKYEKNSGWIKCRNLEQGRQGPCASTVDTLLYICGGWHWRTDKLLKSVEAYDLLENRCSAVGELVHAVQMSACAAYKGLIYVFGGYLEGAIETDCVQIYDTRVNTCSLFSKPMPSPESASRALSCNNSVILLNHLTCFIYNFETEIWQEREQFRTCVTHFGLVHDAEEVYVFGGGTVEEKEADGKWLWKCRDEVKCVRMEDIFTNEMVEWKQLGHLFKPTCIHAYS